jgi:hypothetical protein
MASSFQLFKKIRQIIWNFQFKRELAQVDRYKKYVHLKDAENIGILYDASNEENYKIVFEFIRNLTDQQKKCKSLGFVNNSVIPHYCHPRLSFDYFTLKDHNWYNRPVSVFVKDYIQNEFDISINLDIGHNRSLNYISGLSRAHFKVGRYHEDNTQLYDFMIDMKDPVSLESYIKELTHYLSILKTSVKRKVQRPVQPETPQELF